jgi:hypothetical protein
MIDNRSHQRLLNIAQTIFGAQTIQNHSLMLTQPIYRSVHFRCRKGPIYLSGWQRAGPVPTRLHYPADRHHRRGHTPLTRQQEGLRRL